MPALLPLPFTSQLPTRMLCRHAAPPETQVYTAAPPPPQPPYSAAGQTPGSVALSWTSVLILLGATLTTVAGSFIVFVLYLRPVLRAAERAAAAAERAAQEMEVAAVVSCRPACCPAGCRRGLLLEEEPLLKAWSWRARGFACCTMPACPPSAPAVFPCPPNSHPLPPHPTRPGPAPAGDGAHCQDDAGGPAADLPGHAARQQGI